MISRIPAPCVYVLLQSVNSPDFETLSGTRAIQDYGIVVYVITRGSTYQTSYRMGMDIVGEIFDELYVNTGVDSSTDSIRSYNVQLDTKMDEDEIVCVHQLSFSYLRRINLLHR